MSSSSRVGPTNPPGPAGRATYRYRAARDDGSIEKGVVRDVGRHEAVAGLRRRGLHPLDVQRVERTRWRVRPGRRQLAVAFRSLANLVAAGVPIDRALAASAGLARGRTAESLESARAAIRDGASLAEALASEGIAPSTVVGMVRAGERASRIDVALDSAADQLESEAEFLSQIRSALAYPALILIVGAMSVVVLGVVVVPRFAELIEGMGSELPASTRAIVAASTFLVRWGWLILSGVVTVSALWMTGRLGDGPTRRLHSLLLRAPVIGRIRLSMASARVCQALGGMLQGGMPLMDAVAVVERASGDLAVRERLGRVRDRLRRGEPLSTALEEERAMDPGALQLVQLGEASGQIGQMALRASEVLLRETRRSIGTAVALAEPVLIVILGGAVAFMSAALLRAVYSIRPG